MAPVHLYTAPTPNGHPISVFLEELKASGHLPDGYEFTYMSIRDSDIGKVHNQVKQQWFLDINPNGRIPAITHDGFSVFETSAILLYLAATFDKDNQFSFDPKQNPKEYSELLQWLFFVHGGLGPMQGQAHHFALYAPQKIEYGINRYVNETRRLYAVLDTRLKDREFIMGKYTIADMKTVPWIQRGVNIGIKLEEEFPAVDKWVKRFSARAAVQEGYKVPPPPQ